MKLIMEGWRGYLNNLDEAIIAIYLARIKIEYKRVEERSEKEYTTSHLPQKRNLRDLEQQQEFRDTLDYKRDAFRHILANAWISHKFPNAPMTLLGQAVELAGATRNLLKPLTRLKKPGKFDSGWKMDTANNKIGVELAKKFSPNTDFEKAVSMVRDIIDSGKFYVTDGKTSYETVLVQRDTARKPIVSKPRDLKVPPRN
jgi:hypothetical protein